MILMLVFVLNELKLFLSFKFIFIKLFLIFLFSLSLFFTFYCDFTSHISHIGSFLCLWVFLIWVKIYQFCWLFSKISFQFNCFFLHLTSLYFIDFNSLFSFFPLTMFGFNHLFPNVLWWRISYWFLSSFLIKISNTLNFHLRAALAALYQCWHMLWFHFNLV